MKKYKKPLLIIVGSIVILLIIAFVALTLSFSGGIEGVVHEHRKLPDFSAGKPAANRKAYQQEVAIYDDQLIKLTDKKYKMSFSDTCERSQYNFKVKSDYLSSCERHLTRLYLTNKNACDLLPAVKAVISAEFVNDGGCTGQNPNGNFNELTKDGNGLDNVRIAVIDKQTAVNGIGLYVIENLYEGRRCPYVAFCEYEPGDYEQWPSMVMDEKYATVVILESRRMYYRE